MAVERAVRRERRNVQRRPSFAKSDIVSDWARSDPDLIEAWGLDRSRTTTKAAARRRCRISDQLVKIGVAESLSAATLIAGKGKARGGRAGMASAADTAQCTEVEEAERLRGERQATANQGSRGPYLPFRRWKDHVDDDSDGSVISKGADDDYSPVSQSGPRVQGYRVVPHVYF